MDFDEIKKHCERHSALSLRVNDNFLMNFIADREGMHKKMHLFEKKYKHVIKKLPQEFFGRAMAQYIIGKALQQDGLINKYLNNTEIRSLKVDEKELLEFQIAHPWRYSFASIIEHSHREFFLLEDVFTEDRYLLYSPGMEAYYNDGYENALYFILTGYNGQCWQSYGLMLAMKSFTPDDIFFYATEISRKVESEESLMESVYDDPMVYLMLAVGMDHPVVMNKEDELRIYTAIDDMNEIDTEVFKNHFKVEWNKNVYRFSHDGWSEHPHFANVYYDERKKELMRYSMTARGFDRITAKLLDAGIPVSEYEDYSVSMSMAVTMGSILGKRLVTDPYEMLFDKQEPGIDKEELDDINRFMGLVLPYINSGTEPDIAALAKQAGIDVETARGIYEKVKGRF